MGCSNFCTTNNFSQISATVGYKSQSEQNREYYQLEKGREIYQAMVSASTIDSGMNLEEAATRFGGDWSVVGTLGLAVVGLGILTALGEAITAMVDVKRSIEK